jgi:triacylglycerol lipase
MRRGATRRSAVHKYAARSRVREHEADAHLAIWKEALFGAELLLLHASPVFYGLGIPHGEGAAVVVIPGFLGSDIYVAHLNSWLQRVGYRSHLSNIGVNAECPNLLIRYRLAQTIRKAHRESGAKVHLIGHSLGGIIARSVAAQMPGDVASVTTLGAPFRGTVLHQSVLDATNVVRRHILDQHGEHVNPDCYTPRCTCDFVNSLRGELPESVVQTAIYTRDDGIVNWRYCRSGCGEVDFEVSGTHVGLVFNPSVYTIIAERLAWIDSES